MEEILIYVDLTEPKDCEIFEAVTEDEGGTLEEYKNQNITAFMFDKDTGEIVMYIQDGRVFSSKGNMLSIKDLEGAAKEQEENTIED